MALSKESVYSIFYVVYRRKKNKDDKIKEESKKKRKEEKESTLKQEDENYERSIQSAERYQEWAEKKGKPRRGPPPPTLTQRYHPYMHSVCAHSAGCLS